jgi:hypothetical protein
MCHTTPSQPVAIKRLQDNACGPNVEYCGPLVNHMFSAPDWSAKCDTLHYKHTPPEHCDQRH